MKIGKYKFRYEIIKLFDKGSFTALEAAWDLNISIRHARRLLAMYRRNKRSKKAVLLFLPKERPSAWNGKDQEIIGETVHLKKEIPGRSNQRIAEMLRDKLLIAISPSSVRNILLRNNCYERAKRERRAFIRLEERITRCGQMVQFDVCEGAWLKGYRRVYLIAFLDAYSRYVVGWKWVDTNSAWNNILVLSSVARNYGVPELFYTDNASFYKVIRHNKSIHQEHKPEDEYETAILANHHRPRQCHDQPQAVPTPGQGTNRTVFPVHAGPLHRRAHRQEH